MNHQRILSSIAELQKEADSLLHAIDILRELVRDEVGAVTNNRRLGIVATEIAGKTLGSLPIRRLSKAGLHNAEKRTGLKNKRRPYTKKSAFWNKLHPRAKNKK
jgi:hypothetical protein